MIDTLDCDTSTARTQKVRGLRTLAAVLTHHTSTPFRLLPHLSLEEVKEIEEAGLNVIYTYPIFARPCPVRPRHGFVDSRVVKNFKELKALWIETLEADPLGEVMIALMIDAQYNAVITPQFLSIGRGHDGATGGRKTYQIPLCCPYQGLGSDTLDMAGIYAPNIPYIEAVLPRGWRVVYSAGNIHRRGWVLTQLRAGPAIDGASTTEYIPRPIERITDVITPSGDDSLLDWEIRIAELKPSDIVYLRGGSMTSHFAIHAILNEIAFVTRPKRPAIGSSLAPTTTIPEYDPLAFLRGLALGDLLGQRIGSFNVLSQITLALTGLYNAHVLRGPDTKWLGVATALFIKLGSMALRGEARHCGGAAGERRATVYRKYAKEPLAFHAADSSKWVHIFKHGRFGNGGMGGQKWVDCARGIESLLAGVSLLSRLPTPEGVKIFLTDLNRVVDLAHNNGWWLNKFANGNVYNEVQKGYLPTLLEGAQLLPMIASIERYFTDTMFKESNEVYRHWVPKPLEVHSRMESAEISRYAMGGNALLRIREWDSLLQENRKDVTLEWPSSMWSSTLEKLLHGGLRVSSNKVGDKLKYDFDGVSLTKRKDRN